MTDENILDTLRALKAKAENDASSEAEARACLSRLAKLMAKHDVTEADITEKRDEPAVHHVYDGMPAEEFAMFDSMWSGLERFCEVTTYHTRSGDLRARSRVMQHPNFIGTSADVEMAIYVMEICRWGAKRAFLMAKAAAFDQGASKPKKHDFYYGFGQGVHSLMVALAKERVDIRTTGSSSCTDLVVVKDALIDAKKKEMGLRLHSRKSRHKIDHESSSKGYAEGRKVNLNRPVETSGGRTAVR